MSPTVTSILRRTTSQLIEVKRKWKMRNTRTGFSRRRFIRDAIAYFTEFRGKLARCVDNCGGVAVRKVTLAIRQSWYAKQPVPRKIGSERSKNNNGKLTYCTRWNWCSLVFSFRAGRRRRWWSKCGRTLREQTCRRILPFDDGGRLQRCCQVIKRGNDRYSTLNCREAF